MACFGTVWQGNAQEATTSKDTLNRREHVGPKHGPKPCPACFAASNLGDHHPYPFNPSQRASRRASPLHPGQPPASQVAALLTRRLQLQRPYLSTPTPMCIVPLTHTHLQRRPLGLQLLARRLQLQRAALTLYPHMHAYLPANPHPPPAPPAWPPAACPPPPAAARSANPLPPHACVFTR